MVRSEFGINGMNPMNTTCLEITGGDNSVGNGFMAHMLGMQY